MKFISIAAIALASVATVLADSCNRGGVYCGVSLLRKSSPYDESEATLVVTGNYHDHIVQVLEAAGQPTDDQHIQNSIFDCLDGGEIRLRGFCANGCGGVDSEDPDFCF